ncbi:pseudouridine synthase [Aquimarina brevivitae]|uniref:23S rRNA pseudouridine2605 synthase n=1 Tax=Aquimarina brevivitae TaxID=323412 RepID=A0A4Q7PIV6_9FLAO|nr:pseudouridine synthase [Aquimarina brevivitae]RZS99760.1 23S rRNA pseudouridine2605 synthase [Aquimarina brevivitae]
MSRGGSRDKGKSSGRQGGKARDKSFARGNAPIRKSTTAHKKSNNDEIRLNKYIANSGICSRREADLYIQSGNVWVNGKPVTEMGYKVKLTDEVKFDGRSITPEKKEYILLNKPKGYITSTSLEKSKTVMELVANATRSRIKPVDRLGRNSLGLLLFTNDDQLEKKLTNHRVEYRKIYHVELDRNFKPEDFEKISGGIKLEEGFIRVDEVSFVEGGTKKEIGIQLQSSKNEIVRKIFEHLNYNVLKMDRVVFAGLTKKDLPRGKWRRLTEQEVINLKMI